MRKLTLFWLLLLLPGQAGQLKPLPLKEVVSRVQRIVIAKIQSVEHQKSSHYQVWVERDLLKKQPLGQATFSYHCNIEDLEFEAPGPNGQTMHYSVMTEASGHEYEPKTGETWIFLLHQSTGQATARIEPISSLNVIELQLRSYK